MINKLKKKFIVLATFSMLLLMAVLVLMMNLINYRSVIAESDTVLDMLSGQNLPFSENLTHSIEPPDLADFIPRGMSPEVPYESRYFSALVSADGEVLESDFSKIISVDSDSARDYIEKAIKSAHTRGFIGQFRFVKTGDDKVTRIVFLDCGRKLDAFRTFLWTSIAVGLAGCVLVFVVFLLAAGKIIRPIAESYEKQKRFISDAGHEIKTPLTIIHANLDLLESDEGEKEELSEIRTQTKRLTALTKELVLLSKMEEQEHSLPKVECPVSDLVGETAGSFRALALAQKIRFSVQIQPNLSVKGAPDALRQLASVLLENAMKYTPEGGEVALELAAQKKNLLLSISNTTKEQMMPEDLPRLFDRFYRTDASRNSETGGHGIGLSIAKAITEAHGGTITAGTQTGLDFWIRVSIPF